MVRYLKRFGVLFQLWLVLLILVTNVHDSVAWGPQGHRVIGFIAESHLQPKVEKLILEKFNIKSLADVATWADEARKKRKEENPWHYTNIAEGQWTYDAARDCPSGSCVTEQIQKFSDILDDPSAPLQQRKGALKYLVHFVGDVHQPLHLGNKKDRGGGTLHFPYKGKVVSLHYLWDGGLINWQGSLLKYATSLNGKVLEGEISSWNLSTVADWANESRSMALKSAYNVEKGSLSKAYIERGREIIDLRLTQAGVRLAHLLNTILTIK
ncbi:MAG: S1/P1 nuclease [Nitrospinae bacterium]|nr:S1/P1 nuclease [Nitrospinota bacterium]MBL7021249.1 S1/P1 nuclease [Nitrospinaceae bacterium]